MAGGNSGRKVVLAAMAGNALIAVTKFVASAMSGSAAMLSEGIHSVVNTGNQALLLLGMKRAQRPPSPEYPFGHGRELYFWAFVVAILIFGIGAGLSFYEGVRSFAHPEPVENPVVNYVVLGFAMLFEGGAWLVALRTFRRTKGRLGWLEAVRRSKDPSVCTVLFEDSAAMIGLVIAFLGIALGQVFDTPVFGSIASMLIGVVLAITAALLARETKGLLIGESASSEVVEGIRRAVVQDRRVERALKVLTMHLGPDDILLTLTVEFRDELSAPEVEDAVCSLEHRIQERYPQVRHVFIEAESLREHRQRRGTRQAEVGSRIVEGRA
jgi:cation diffusion facilitator family transporter